MILKAPAINDRNFKDIVSEALALVKHYCPEWKAGEYEKEMKTNDPGKALIYLFAHLMEIIITRLNRVPDKYFLAFLDFIGASLQPPAPAVTLLQFFLSDGAKTDQWVPAGTQVSTEETRDLEEQIFETTDHLVVTPVKLISAFTPEPGNEQGIDRTTVVTSSEKEGFEVFNKQDPGFYLGFDTPFSNDTHALFFQVIENEGDSRSLMWEYSGSDGWIRLNVKDETRDLSRPGHVRFIGPEEFSQKECFGFHRYWLRVCLIEASEPFSPILERVYLNTVWAENVETIKDELLGSGDGRANQTFQLSQSPVLPGQQVWVVEREMPLEDEYEKIVEEEGEDAVVIERDEKGTIIEIRVRWHEVDNFYGSGPRSRHYIMEPAAGKVYFGDGTRGMMPPIGTDNIVCSVYQTGGGAQGNVGCGKITQLKASLPYIDSVTNVLPAGGGVDGETLEEIKERGPYMLKHRDRAVTAEDFEWLMQEAPADIAVCKCIPADDWATSGKVTVIIVPDLDHPKPFPAEGLIGKVEGYLYERNLVSLAADGSPGVRVTGPNYIKVWAEAGVVPKNIDQAGRVEEKVIANLETFFHPLKGGPDNKGWPFGRDVPFSEVMEVIQHTEGVDFVKALRLKAPAQIYNLTLNEPIPLYFPAGSEVSSADRNIKYLLAEEIEETHKLIVKGFKQGDSIRIIDKDNPDKLLIDRLCLTGVFGDELRFETITVNVDIPVGSVVVTPGNKVKSIILKAIPKNTKFQSIKIRVIRDHDAIIIRCGDIRGYFDEKIVKDVDRENPVRIYLEPDSLVYSGKHSINMVMEEVG
ncbi:MAG: putative baseplate assembly protein [Candidatus Aminicenantes bacterium]|nr:putative baseplate assembly protein [Candidatus Aminicenantes bacterium]NIM77152.1 putative baseplate assembly protein [Candidatus Aminicenantes bacterium]NIN16445.1 putative baseplate assembly protein [Candidatus Aminicenantes bacterium]NIN40306.1 putative baseplate assembly protein [Candidatus Aminicenantes bacterium]NIN83125.1 putative baseplate assembly protein [Candidatus Aminicenantes bacterium]